MNKLLQPSLITSFYPLSSVEALRMLPQLEGQVERRRGRTVNIDTVDLYCLGRKDPTSLCPERPILDSDSIAHWLAGLEISHIQQISQKISQLLIRGGRPPRKIASLVTNLPSISVPATHSNGKDALQRGALKALQNLLHLANRLRVSCILIVCGANFVRGGRQVKDWRTKVGRVPAEQRRQALCEALAEVNSWIAQQRWEPPTGLAIEIEPGISYGVNSGEEVLQLFEELDRKCGGYAAHIALNLDIGHAWLISKRSPGLRQLLSDNFLSRIAHAHISAHVTGAHFADLPAEEPDLMELDSWLRLFAQSQADGTRCTFATRTIAVEQEAAVPLVRAVETYLTLDDWLKCTDKPRQVDLQAHSDMA